MSEEPTDSGLVVRILTVRIKPAFGFPRVLHLENRPEKGHAERYRIVTDSSQQGAETVAVVSRDDAVQLRELLREGRIAAVASGALGLDGTTYELSFDEGMTGASYRWWLSPPKGWEVLGEIVEILRTYARGW